MARAIGWEDKGELIGWPEWRVYRMDGYGYWGWKLRKIKYKTWNAPFRNVKIFSLLIAVLFQSL